ncbi:haloacid dehalogenase type II [Nesterenkonia jeotgali]|uniref:Haloacid dehalogenase n=1 Tax=Nesterenkonia jeotgali TaxID=317018 RepID=A0A0W8II34_9MICC|nr:haloacid dehalogenase type II [Nesterenkonia jeotgali]KUG59542.1 haloacid dehalogenase [Nesterenkonia jeotgali]MBA8922243.1 2-haloacid dehalogenase [Nesterenkonia jeotgali]
MTPVPAVLVFDVNETLSDMRPLAAAFEAAGLPAGAASLWFSEVLRDGFALTTTGVNPDFVTLARDGLDRRLAATSETRDRAAEVDRILEVFKHLDLHPDVAPGVTALSRTAELVTLSNGSAAIAESLLESGGVRGRFAQCLSVQDAPRWKPAREAYDYAAQQTGRAAQELMLVAVHPWDIHGAAAAGLRTAWINRTGAAYPSYFQAPEIEAEHLVGLAEILTATED